MKDRRESVRVREFRKRYFEIRISLFRLLKTAVPPTVRAVLRLRSAVCVIVLGSSSSGEVVLVFWHASVQAYKIILLYTQIGEEMILPRIIVIGNESSGKSSTLDRIAGQPVLPCADGICTRAPVVLELKYDPGAVTTQFFSRGSKASTCT